MSERYLKKEKEKKYKYCRLCDQEVTENYEISVTKRKQVLYICEKCLKEEYGIGG